jgi:hypothetical protein
MLSRLAQLTFTISTAVVVASCSPKPIDLVKAYERAYNSDDLDSLMTLFAQDATFEVVGQFAFKEMKQIRDIAGYDFALNIHMTISGFTAKSDTVLCTLAETNDWLKAAGIGQATYSAMFVFDQGLIRLIRAESTPETEKAFNGVLSPLLEWASEHRPEQLAEMMPEGRFVYNAENAKRSLALLREWKQATKSEEDL